MGIKNPGVLLATKIELQAIRDQYPGFAPDSAPFTLAVWEDDNEAGKIVKKDFWEDIVRPTLQGIAGALLVTTVIETTEYSDPHGLMLIPGGVMMYELIEGFVNLVVTILGGNDDFLGLIVEAEAFFEATGVTSDSSYSIIRNTQKNGEASLYMRNYSWE